MKKEYIIALDQGTTNSRAILVDQQGDVIAIAQEEIEQLFPNSGWVEHDPMNLLKTQLQVLKRVVTENNIAPSTIKAMGITNQRETTIVWDKNTGKPIYNAIVWQDRRTVSICETLKKQNLTAHVKRTTGLVIDAYFSGTKLKWILDNIEGAREKATDGELLFGTVDTWLLWNLTKGAAHYTDYTNASRTMLYDIIALKWDKTLLDALGIPPAILPEVKPSASYFGTFELSGIPIPITGIAGDQQAALFGQGCFEKGDTKNTYGTGCFLLMNTGEKAQFSDNGLLTTMACGTNDTVHYALEGSIFVAGAAIQWLRDGLQIINTASESETLAREVKEDNPVYVVPAFAGLGAPYWDMYARGAIFGLTRDTGKHHIARATLEALAYQVKDLIDLMEKDSGTSLTTLKVDGGAAANNFLMQFQANILNTDVLRPKIIESTAMGAAFLAGITVGLWSYETLRKKKEIDRTFIPVMEKKKRKKLYQGWKKAIKRTQYWNESD